MTDLFIFYYSYGNYDWIDFDDEVMTSLEVFGYDEDSWSGGDSTEYDDMFWDELPEDVQEAAMELCYTRELWNEEPPINEWDQDTVLPGSSLKPETSSPTPAFSDLPSSSPTNSPTTTVSPTVNLSLEPSKFGTEEPSLQPSLSSSPSASLKPTTTTQPSTEPSAIPSLEPSSSTPTYYPTNLSTTTPTYYPTNLPTTTPTFDESKLCRSLNPLIDYFCPVKRYCEWNFWEVDTRLSLTKNLGYNEKTWNFERRAESDYTAFEELSGSSKKMLKGMGFDEDAHDCCNGHYESYLWSELHDEAKVAWEALGYDENTWESGGPSKYDEYEWDDLPKDIQLSAMTHLCYSRELWDEEPLPDWPQNVILPGSFIEGEVMMSMQNGQFLQAETSDSNTFSWTRFAQSSTLFLISFFMLNFAM